MGEDELDNTITQVEEEAKQDSSTSSTNTDTKTDSDTKLDIENPDEIGKTEEGRERVGRMATIINLLNSLLGATIFSLPGKFGEIGLIPSVILLVIACYISYVCTVMLVKLQNEVNGKSLDDIALKVIGKPGQIIVSILTLIFCIAGVLAYVVIACDAIAQWFTIKDIAITYWRRVLLTIVYSIFPVACSIPKSLKFLSYISSLTIIIMVFYVIVVIIRAPKIIPTMNFKDPRFTLGKAGIGIFSAISILFLNFTLPMTTLPIIENYNKDLKKRNYALMFTSVICYFILVIPAILGYLMVFDSDSAQLIFSYEKFQKDVLFNIVKAGCFVAVSCSYPIFVRPVLNSWSQFIFKENDSTLLPWKKRGLIHVISHTIPVLIAAFYPNVMPLLDYTGASACLIDLSTPGLLWYFYYKPSVKSFQFWGCLFLFVLGIFLAVSTIAVTILNATKA